MENFQQRLVLKFNYANLNRRCASVREGLCHLLCHILLGDVRLPILIYSTRNSLALACDRRQTLHMIFPVPRQSPFKHC